MLGTNSYKLVQIGEERKSVGRPVWSAFTASGLTLGVWLFWILSPARLPIPPLRHIPSVRHHSLILMTLQHLLLPHLLGLVPI